MVRNFLSIPPNVFRNLGQFFDCKIILRRKEVCIANSMLFSNIELSSNCKTSKTSKESVEAPLLSTTIRVSINEVRVSEMLALCRSYF